MKPDFEVCVGNPAGEHKWYRIWANGQTEGFKDGDKPVLIVNRIPLHNKKPPPISARVLDWLRSPF